MTPSRLLLSCRLASAVAEDLATSLPELLLRVRQRPGCEDLTWADSYSGFVWPMTERHASFDWVHAMGAGVDRFLEHSSSIGVLTRTVGGMPERMGNFVLALLLEQAHHLNAYAEAQRRREWKPVDAIPLPERCVVIGTGATAAGIATVLGRHGIDVVGVNRSGRPADGFRMVHAWEALDRALDGCQLLVLALPATPYTNGIVN